MKTLKLNLIEKWAHLGSNQGPTGYEPVALPTELWARKTNENFKFELYKHAHVLCGCLRQGLYYRY